MRRPSPPHLVCLAFVAAALIPAGCGSGSDSSATAQVQAPPTVVAPTGSSATVPAAQSTQATAEKQTTEKQTTETQATATTAPSRQTGGASHAQSTPTASPKLGPCAKNQIGLIRKIQSLVPASPRARELSRKLHKLASTDCGTRRAGSTSGNPPEFHNPAGQ